MSKPMSHNRAGRSDRIDSNNTSAVASLMLAMDTLSNRRHRWGEPNTACPMRRQVGLTVIDAEDLVAEDRYRQSAHPLIYELRAKAP